MTPSGRVLAAARLLAWGLLGALAPGCAALPTAPEPAPIEARLQSPDEPRGAFGRLHAFLSGEHRPGAIEDAEGAPGETSGPDPDGEEGEADHPDLHDPPLLRFGVPPERHDPFLFPALINLLDEDPGFIDEDAREDRREQIEARRRFNIRRPGPDTANFPNSAYTLPKGRAYLEQSPLSMTAPIPGLAGQVYNWGFLARYGLTDNLEFRLFSNGLTAALTGERTVGFAPLAFDFKANFWEENREYYLPAMGLEVFVQTTFGSPELNAGTQPALNMLFSQELPIGLGLEWNVGLQGNQDAETGQDFYVLTVQWAASRELSERLSVFYHGYFNGANLPRIGNTEGEPDGVSVVQGLGAIYVLNDRLCVFGSYNLGVGNEAPSYYYQLGLATAF